jgi:O-antigen/teichoic acid export membrane protein
VIDDHNETKRGILWLGSATLVTRLIDVGASLATIALLSREDMGTAALVLSTATVVESVSGIGLGHALIQDRNLSADQEQSLFWLASGFGLFLGLVMLAISPFVASAYGLPVLVPMLALTGLKMLLVGTALVPQQLLSKHLMFREAGAVQTIGTLGEGVTKITLAALGFGAWSLVLSNVTRGVVLLLAVLSLSRFRPRRHFHFDQVRSHLKFGSRVAASGLLYQTYRNADYFLVGRFLGIEILGVYRVAFDVGMQPMEVVLTIINRVSYPIYAKVAHDLAALKTALLRSTRSLTLLGAPIIVFLFMAIGDVVPLISKARWAGAVPAVQVLVWGALLRGNAHIFPTAYVAAGKPHYAVLDSALSLVALVSSFWLGLTWFPQFGVLPVCWAWILVYPALLTMHLGLTKRIMPFATFGYFKALFPGLAGAAVMLLVMACTIPLGLHRFGHVASLVIWALSGVGAYTLYLRVALGVGFQDLVPKKA